VSNLDSLYDGMDETSADHARAAMEWMLPDGGGLAEVTQMKVQQFVWYFLPAKWLTNAAEHHEIARSLGDLLSAAGLDRYAAICRDPLTHRVIDAYEVSSEVGRQALREALEGSGVEPPDSDVLSWGSVMGIDESQARDDVSTMLEAAIVKGDLVVGGRGWKAQAARLTAAFLELPTTRFGGRTPLEVVRAERMERWVQLSNGPARQRLFAEVLPLLREPAVMPEALADSLAPVRALLTGVGDGVTLTQAGYLPKALVVTLNDRFKWYDLAGYKANSEADVIALLDLHALLRRARLLTKRGRKLAVSAAGQRCLADDERLFGVLAVQAMTGDDFDVDVATMRAAHLLTVAGEPSETAVDALVYDAVAERWSTHEGNQPSPRVVRGAGPDWQWNARTLGWLKEGGDWQHRTLHLTEIGRAAAIIGLQSVAGAPRHRL
jgi:hypothetical protein